MAPRIRITVDGKLALTTGQVAAEFGLEPASARQAIRRLGLDPVDYLDDRTPLYAAAPVRKAMRDRPGKGANLRAARRTGGSVVDGRALDGVDGGDDPADSQAG